MIFSNRHIVAIDDSDSILNFLRISLEALGAHFEVPRQRLAALRFAKAVSLTLSYLIWVFPIRRA